MNSNTLGSNMFVNRFQALSGLPNISILPKAGDIYSVDNVNLKFIKLSTLVFPPKKIGTIDWIGNITIEVLEVTPNGNLFNIKSKISFVNINNSDLTIPELSSDDTNLNFTQSTNIIDLRTNFISLTYKDDENNSNTNVSTSQSHLFLTDLRLIFNIEHTDYIKNLNYNSLSYLSLNKK